MKNNNFHLFYPESFNFYFVYWWNNIAHHFLEENPGQERAAKRGNLTEVRGFEPANFAYKDHDVIHVWSPPVALFYNAWLLPTLTRICQVIQSSILVVILAISLRRQAYNRNWGAFLFWSNILIMVTTRFSYTKNLFDFPSGLESVSTRVSIPPDFTEHPFCRHSDLVCSLPTLRKNNLGPDQWLQSTLFSSAQLDFNQHKSHAPRISLVDRTRLYLLSSTTCCGGEAG